MGRGLMQLVLPLLLGCGRIAFDARTDAGVVDPDARLDAGSDATDALVVDPSLLLWLSFESGLTADTTMQHDATCTSCPTLTAGPRTASAALFDGVDDCLLVDLPLALRPSAELTFALWARVDGTGSQTLFGAPYMSDTEFLNSFEMYSDSDDLITVQLNTAGFVNVPVARGEWHHLAGVYDGTLLRVYLDGVFVGSIATAPPAYATDVLRIGCDRDNGVVFGFLIGALDDVQLYNRPLTAGEVAALAQ